MNDAYGKWLKGHLAEAKVRYAELSKLDDEQYAAGGSTEYYEQAHQMFGYVAALEKCVKQLTALQKAKPKTKKK